LLYTEVAKVPTFALGDSSGIVPKARYTVILVDTTEDDKRTLHFAQANFALTEIVNIASETTPVLAYQAPGAFKETGEHKYTFLLYQHFANAEKDTLKIPDEGATFTVKQFQDDNEFGEPVGGLGMVVDLAAGGGGDAPVSSSAVQLTSSTAIEVATSSVVEEQPESTVAASSSVRASSVVITRVSSAIVSSATDNSEVPETTDNAEVPETTAEAPITTSATPRTTGLVIASSILQSAGPSASITVLPSSTGTPTGTPTGTGGAAQQSDSGASGIALGTASCAVGAAMVVFAGLLAW
jgi:hypothetical protein